MEADRSLLCPFMMSECVPVRLRIAAASLSILRMSLTRSSYACLKIAATKLRYASSLDSPPWKKFSLTFSIVGLHEYDEERARACDR